MNSDHDAKPARPGPRSIVVRAVLIAGAAALLAGCNSYDVADLKPAAPFDYRQRHPIVIKEKDNTVELFVGKKRGSLTPTQRADVLAFARSWRREATGGIVVEVPVGKGNSAAANGVAHEVRAILTAVGIPPHAIATRRYRLSDPARLATVRLNYPRMAAEAGPCGLWPQDLSSTNESYRQNEPYWNFGCATQRNLAAMVAEPADLAQPRGEGPVYQMRRTMVLENYRKGEPTAAKAATSDSAKISDVGK